MARAGEYQTGIADALEILGALAPGAEDHHKATRLLGAADAIRHETGYQRFRLHQHGYDATVQALRTAVGDARAPRVRYGSTANSRPFLGMMSRCLR